MEKEPFLQEMTRLGDLWDSSTIGEGESGGVVCGEDAIVMAACIKMRLLWLHASKCDCCGCMHQNVIVVAACIKMRLLWLHASRCD